MKPPFTKAQAKAVLAGFVSFSLVFSGLTLVFPGAETEAAGGTSFPSSGINAIVGTSTSSLTAAEIARLDSVNGLRFSPTAAWPLLAYDESKYHEFLFTPGIPSDAIITAASVTHNYRSKGATTSTDAAKLEFWNGTDFSNQASVTVGAINVDVEDTVNIFSFINTPAKANGLRVRFLGHFAATSTGTSHDMIMFSYTTDDVPVANAQSVTTPEDTALAFTLTATDSNDTIVSYATSTSPANGTLTFVNAATGQMQYVPAANYNGSDAFDFFATDSYGATSSVATVSITINPVNDVPVVTSVTVVPASPTTNQVISASVLASDADGDPITYGYQWKNNAVNLVGATGTSLDLSVSGHGDKGDVMTLGIIASDASSSSAEFISSGETIANTGPTATNGSATTNEDTPVLIALAGTDVDNDVLTFAIATNPSNGSLGTISGNQVTYTPNLNWNGSDSFTFTANDGIATSAAATVNITVNAINDPPLLAPVGNKTVDEMTLLSFSATTTDPDGAPATFSLTGTVPTGASIGASSGAFSFTPAENQGPGNHTFTVAVSDSNGGNDSEQITVMVNEVNISPVALPVLASTTIDTPVTVAFSGSDADLPANTLTYLIVTGPSKGTLGAVSGNQVTYTPNAGTHGVDTFTYRIFDGTLGADAYSTSTTATVVVPKPPASSPAAGTYTFWTTITLTAQDSTSIRYTLDGTMPDCATSAGTLYPGPFEIVRSKTINAISCYVGGVYSTVGTLPYSINLNLLMADFPGAIARGVFLPATGTPTTATPSFTVTQPVWVNVSSTFGYGTSTVALPEDLVASREDGGMIDVTRLIANDSGFTVAEFPQITIGDGAIKFGITEAMVFTKSAAITIAVNPDVNGRTLNVLRTAVIPNEWTNNGVDPTCVANSARCSFAATKSSYYAATHPAPVVGVGNSGGGASGGGASSGGSGSSGGGGGSVAAAPAPSAPSAPSPAPTPAPAPTVASNNTTPSGSVAGASTIPASVPKKAPGSSKIANNLIPLNKFEEKPKASGTPLSLAERNDADIVAKPAAKGQIASVLTNVGGVATRHPLLIGFLILLFGGMIYKLFFLARKGGAPMG